MTSSVLIPTYNSARTIEATLRTVLEQTRQPDEVLIMDDGSTDDTMTVIRKYVPRIKILTQANGGVARARNALAKQAQGDLLAFLDHDDLWHPDYLATQIAACEAHPEAVCFFTQHLNFYGFGGHQWNGQETTGGQPVEVISGLNFFQQYHRACAKFASMSFCCIPGKVMRQLGEQPFHPEVPGVDDYYIFHTMMLLGPTVFTPRCLVAYRFTTGAQSASLLKSVEKAVRSLELLEPRFQKNPNPHMRRAFGLSFAMQRREFGRVLMGVGERGAARRQFMKSLGHSTHPVSLAKSLMWHFLMSLPRQAQPNWPSEWKKTHVTPTHSV